MQSAKKIIISKWLWCGLLWFGVMPLSAQQIELQGRVIDQSDRQVLENVNIKLVGSNVAVTTDRKGLFTLRVATLPVEMQLSLTGYRTLKIKVSEPKFLDIEMEATSAILKEVTVSTGYETLPKERATGSFVQIDQQTYNQQIGTNVLDRLRTITNGVAPVSDRVTVFGDNAMLIRGMSTLTPSIQKPLIIIDNFEYQGDINNINPNDIASVTFLKDAAAGSIWGAKAANGVIVLTTKKGRYGQSIKIDLVSNLTLANPPDLYYDQAIQATDLIEVERFLFSRQYRFTDTARSNRPPFSPVYELLFQNRAGRLSQPQLESQLASLAQQDVRDDFANYFYRKMVNHQHALSMSGGSETLAWSLGLGADFNISDLSAKYNRYTLRWANQFKFSKKLMANLETAYTYSNSKSGAPAYGALNVGSGQLPIYTSLSDDNGQALPLYAFYRQGYIDQVGQGKLLDWRYYPLTDHQESVSTNQLKDFNATMGLDYQLLPQLKVSLKYRIQNQTQAFETFNSLQSYTTRNLINNFTQVNASTGIISYIIPKGAIVDWRDDEVIAQNLRAQLNFHQDWKKHQLSVLGGTEWSKNQNTTNIDRLYGYDPEISLFGAVDVVNPYPAYLTGGQIYIPNLADRNNTDNRFISLYLNGAYTFNNRYTLSGSARRDASNIFGVATNDRWKPLWSLGASWDILKEGWLKGNPIQQLKLRASYGKQGNIDPRKVAVTTISYQATNNLTGTPYSVINNYPNPDLRWEEVAMTNVGLDVGLFDGKLSASIEYYRKNMNDLYALVPIDLTTGITAGNVLRNVGQAKGAGWDIQVRSSTTLGRMNWHKDLIFNTYTDRISELNQNLTLGRQAMSSGFNILEGYSPSALFAYPWAGLDGVNGDPLGLLNGQPSKDYNAIINQTTIQEAVMIGTQMPKYFGSLGSALAYRNFEFAFRFTFKFDYFFKRNTIDYNALVTKLQGHADYAHRWQRPGDELYTNVPSFIYPMNTQRDEFYRNTEILFERGDHVRLQYINLSYQLRPSTITRLPFKTAKFSIAANQLPIIWKANRVGLDPEAGLLRRSANLSFALNISF